MQQTKYYNKVMMTSVSGRKEEENNKQIETHETDPA